MGASHLGIYPADERVRVGAAQNAAVGHTRQLQVVGVFRGAGHLGVAINLGNGLANYLHLSRPAPLSAAFAALPEYSRSPLRVPAIRDIHDSGGLSRMRSAASSTASMIL